MYTDPGKTAFTEHNIHALDKIQQEGRIPKTAGPFQIQPTTVTIPNYKFSGANCILLKVLLCQQAAQRACHCLTLLDHPHSASPSLCLTLTLPHHHSVSPPLCLTITLSHCRSASPSLYLTAALSLLYTGPHDKEDEYSGFRGIYKVSA